MKITKHIQLPHTDGSSVPSSQFFSPSHVRDQDTHPPPAQEKLSPEQVDPVKRNCKNHKNPNKTLNVFNNNYRLLTTFGLVCPVAAVLSRVA